MPWNAWISSMFPSAPVFGCVRCCSAGIFPNIWPNPKPKLPYQQIPSKKNNLPPRQINLKLRLVAFFRGWLQHSQLPKRFQGFLFFFRLLQGFPMVFRINSPAVFWGNSSFGLWKGLLKGLAPTSQPSALVSRLGPWRSFFPFWMDLCLEVTYIN